MNLSEFGFRNQRLVFLITVTLMAYGLYSYFNLPAQEDPDVPIRESVVSAAYPGLPADRVEQLITKPLEEAVLTVNGVEEIRSTSSDGQSIVYVKAFEHLTELDQIWNEVEEAVQSTVTRLPEGTSTPIVNDNFGDVAVITLALHGEDFDMAELFDFAQHSRESLNTVKGTRRVEIMGAIEERIYVEASNSKLSELGIPPNVLANTIRSTNTIFSGGEIDTGDRAFALIPNGNFNSISDVENLLINVPADGSIVTLRDVANVTRGFADTAPRSAFFNGKEAIVLSLVMQPGQSVLTYSKRAKLAIEELRRSLPVGISLDVITWQADQVKSTVSGVSLSVIQTIVIVLAVVIFFLGLRTGLIVGAIVPTVMLATLAVMGLFDMALERMSLATLVISLGLLVDNGVVVAENFRRRLAEHRDRDLALKETGRELGVPLLSSSLTTILFFLPLMLAQHSSGEFTRSISLVILITLIASWVLAMVVTPILCYKFMQEPHVAKTEPLEKKSNELARFKKIEARYRTQLEKILRNKRAFLLGMLVLLPLGAVLIATTPAQFLPASDRAQVLIYVNLPTGVTTKTTQARIKEMMDIVSDEQRYPDLHDFAAYVGFGGPRFVVSLSPLAPAPHVGFIVINAKDRDAVADAIPRLRNDFRSSLPDVSARVSGMFLGPIDPYTIQIQIKGPDADYLYTESKKIEKLLADVPNSIDVWGDWYNPVTRMLIDVDHVRARNANISSQDVANSLANFVQGRAISEFRDKDEVFPIVTRAVESQRGQIGRLETLAIFPSNSADSVPLTQIANINTERGFSVIQRENLIRTVTVEARNLTLSPEDLVPLLEPKLEQLRSTLAPGYSIELDGIVEDAKLGKAALFANFPLCLGLAILLLVIQFNSYRRPLIVICTIPLIIFGVGLGLKIMQADFGFIVILGIFALAGIIINNAIVLIDRIDIERRKNPHNDFNAVVNASVRRLRPILMTTITTVIGLLPLILGKDVLFYGMASVMAFGLAVGTLLTLGFVPTLYCLFFGIKPEPNS